MAHDVFISYSTKDKTKADAVCARLEAVQIRCWIAPRDVPAGASWPKAITQAIEGCQIMALVFSSSADASEQVERELALAAGRGKMILPFRIEAAPPTGSFAYFLENRHWLDAMTPPLETHLDALADRINLLLGRQPSESVPPSPAPSAKPVSSPPLPPHRFRKATVRPAHPAPAIAGKAAVTDQPPTVAQPDIKPIVLLSLTGHSAEVNSVAFSPDGNRLATASNDKTAKIWDANSGELLATPTDYSGLVVSVAFSPDGKRLATGRGFTARLWDAHSGGLLITFTGHSGLVDAVSFSPDGKRLATGSRDRTAKLWDTDSGKLLTTLSGHSNSFWGTIFSFVSSVAFSPDGKLLATGSDDNAKIRDSDSGKLFATFNGHSGMVYSVAFSPDGAHLVTGGWDKTAKIWNAHSSEPLATLTGHSGPVHSAAFSPDGKRLATGSGDSTAKIWDAGTCKSLATLTGHSGTIFSVAFSPDGKRLATGSGDHTAIIWAIE